MFGVELSFVASAMYPYIFLSANIIKGEYCIISS